LQSFGFEVVFDDHRHAVQRPGQARLGQATVHLVSLFRRVGIDGHDRVNRRPILVESVDTPEIGIHQFTARQPPVAHGVVNLRDGGFFHFERRGCLSH